MSAFMASSKFNGCKETGLAFGINPPPTANAIEHYALGVLAENALPAAFSASCYYRTENMGFCRLLCLKENSDKYSGKYSLLM
jgi:hypothetical protein